MVTTLAGLQPAQPTIAPDTEQTLAAIDIGTNSIHMVVVKIQPILPTFTIVAREKEMVRLGEGALQKGTLSPAAVTRAMRTLKHFLILAQGMQVDATIAVATSAVREATNGQEFLQQVQKELGLHVDLISGQEEARRIYLGVLSGMEFHQKPHVVIDIGGGSTELVLGDGHAPRFLSSTKVGAVRLTSEMVTTDPISSSEFRVLQAYVRGMLERNTDELRQHLKPGEVPRLVGTSGTIETLAALHAAETQGTVPSPLNGYEFSLADLRDMINRLRKLPIAERQALPGLSDRRAEIIVAGALVLQEAMALLGLETIVVCERALREGMIVDWMLTHGLIEDRLRYQREVRHRSVLHLAQKYKVNMPAAKRVAELSLSLFDQTQGVLHPWGPAERQLLWAAAILHNCGLYVNHAAHHKHSYYLIRHGELLGYTEAEIETIANLARYHRKSAPKKKHENYRNLLNKQSRLMVNQLSALLRLAVALDRREMGAIRAVTCECQLDKKQCCLHLQPMQANDDCALELWCLNYKKAAFEAEFGLKLVASLDAQIIADL
ncbi:Ppx/GppA phosphatase family protein [Trichothermofontia sp.]